jgi:hypothetical protein
MVTVSDTQAAALRASLMLNADEAQELRARLTRAGELDGLSELFYAAFVLAVRRRFAPTWTRGRIVRYVGKIRTTGSSGPDIDPLAAEALIRRALGDDVPFAGDKEQEAAAQAILLLCIVADLELDASDVDLLVAEARKLADGWLASQVRL